LSSSFLRRTAVSAALATGIATMVAVPSSVADEPWARPRTVELTGTLLVVAGEDGEQDSYAVQRPDGQVVPIEPGTVDAFDHGAASNSRFAGRVTLPMANGRATTLRGAVQNRTPLSVTSAQIQARPTAQGPVVHRLAVAQVDNLGAYTRTTAQFLADLKVATDYWVDQADGRIASFEIPGSFTQFATTRTTVATGCGLTGDQTTAPEFEPVVQEASALFPGYDFVNGTDQLVVLVPEACRPGEGTAGRGRFGDSVSSGGAVIVGSGSNLGTILAHELGHNYGLWHARTASEEYGDIYELMGSFTNTVPPELGTGFRHEEGLLQGDEVVSLTGRSATTPLLDRARTAETGVRGVEVIDPDNGARLWFDLRTGTGSDSGAGYRAAPTAYGRTYRGAGVVIEQDVDAGTALLFPGGQTALVAGETWSNSSGTMRVSLSALDPAAGTSTLSSAYAPGPAVTGGSATVSGGVRPFETAQAVATGFSPAANGVRYQWFANGAPIPYEESATFDIPLSLAGAALSVQVTGYATGRAPSAPVMSPPVTVAPAIFYVATGTANRTTISGAARTGQVLVATGLNWVGDDGRPPAGLTSTFQWYRGRKQIKGATGASYRLTAADLGQFIAVRNVAAAPGFETGRSTSDSTARVKKGKLPSSKPRIKFKGKKAKAGSRLKVGTGAWLSKVTFRFQWYANGHRIGRATRRTFVVPRSMKRKKIVVKVMGAKRGYKPTARKSGAVRIR
jgi:hypothetical protein